MPQMKDEVRCSFCGKSRNQVQQLITSPHGAFICDECVKACSDIMAGVEEEALRFCFSALVLGTLAENAELSIKRVPLVGRCGICDYEKPIENYNFICPRCGGGLSVVSGRELRVEYVEME